MHSTYRMYKNQCVCEGNGIGMFQFQDQLNTHNPYSMTNTNGIFGLFFQKAEGSIFVRCKVVKEYESKCGDNEYIGRSSV